MQDRPTRMLTALVDESLAVDGDPDGVEICGLTADSREVGPGFVFAALPGTVVDGAKFVPQAIGAGAAAILCGTQADVPETDIPVMRATDPRRALALMAARFYPTQPEITVAVTGTNGKTSVASFVQQMWTMMGHKAASVGTLGVVGADAGPEIIHTTPDPVTLHRGLSALAHAGVTHCVIEASSHGLAQHRVDGVGIAASGFTNISRDHLDYHASFEDYLAQKLRLFSDVTRAGGTAVVNADCDVADRVRDAAEAGRLSVFSVGEKGKDLRLTASRTEGLGQVMTVQAGEHGYDCRLPLVGGFQIENALVAAGLVMACGASAKETLDCLERLEGPVGRLELVGSTKAGGAVFVDFAHTPDALANALAALRPYARGRLVAVFGCGGDRDRGKRPQMGEIGDRMADVAIVTDDNPRTEDPAFVRSEILAAAPHALEIGDRARAIEHAVGMLEDGDVLVIAGKGHETGQIVGTEKIPFRDQDVARRAIEKGRSHVA